MIAKELPGRTDNDVKNYWNTKLRKKLTKMGIDPVSHRPYSQILADYGNISGLPNTATRMGSFSRGLNNTSVSGLPYANTNDVKSLLEQFQVLNLETVQPHFFSDVPSSSSCSYIAQLTSPQSFPYLQPFQPQLSSSSPLGWNDFLVAEPLLPSDFQQQEECDDPQGTFSFSSTTSPSILTQNELPCCKFHGLGYKVSGSFQYAATSGNDMEAGNCHKASSSLASSFVESILDRDSKMSTEFPQLFGESFDY